MDSTFIRERSAIAGFGARSSDVGISTPADGVPTRAPAAEFTPFARTFVCPRCNRPLSLYVQPLHVDTPINCPRCSHPLTLRIREAIREETGLALG